MVVGESISQKGATSDSIGTQARSPTDLWFSQAHILAGRRWNVL
jgi:hypothetical protein